MNPSVQPEDTKVVAEPTVESKHTAPVGFELTTSARSEMHRQVLEQKVDEAEAARRARANFKARPPTVLAAPAFAPRKSAKPLTEISDRNVPFSKTERQGEKRRELEEKRRVDSEA